MHIKRIILCCQCEASKLHQTLNQRGFDPTRENKSEILCAERRKLSCTQPAKHIVVTYGMYHCS
jgi:hypothetical protein